MPELPDVEVFRQYLDSTSLHKCIQKVVSLDQGMLAKTSPRRFRSALGGNPFREATRHGKYVFAKLRDDSFLGLHFGMSGSLEYFKFGNRAPAHTRVLIRFKNGYNLAYISVRKLGKVFIARDPKTFIEKEQLGPDALAIGWNTFQSVFQNRKGSVKTSLMNQHVLAGLGNIYTDEILLQAGIRPTHKCGQLDTKEWRHVFRTMKGVLKAVIKKRANPKRFPDSYLTPHRYSGAKCPRCGTRLKSMKISGRTTYFCPGHQH